MFPVSNFFREETVAKVFFCEFWEIFKDTYFVELRKLSRKYLSFFCKIWITSGTEIVWKFFFHKKLRYGGQWCYSRQINPFGPNVPLFYPRETSENLKVFWWFKGVKKGYIGNKWFNPNLDGGGGIILPPTPCWFSRNNSETVKAVTLAFSWI